MLVLRAVLAAAAALVALPTARARPLSESNWISVEEVLARELGEANAQLRSLRTGKG